MLTPPEALDRILRSIADVAPLPVERVPLAEALGRAIATDVVAPRPLPAFDNAQMDGYALRAADAPRPGVRLPVAFEVFAGDGRGRELPPGSCARIFTGAPLPPGADAVEMQEEVRRSGRHATFRREAVAGRFVRPAGQDVAAGTVALPAGLEVDPGAIGLAAALGFPELPVRRRPRVGILATGDEIVPLGGVPAAGQVFESNGHQLAAACVEAGAVPVRLPVAGDDPGSLARALKAARGLDALVSIGGVSVGERDLVRAGLAGSGARLDFWRVAMRPGKPVAFGRWDRMAVFGLPGNPASSLVTFELFVRPALRALGGLAGTGRMVLRARLSAAQEKPADLTLYLRCRLRREGDSLWVDGLRTQQSGHLTSVVGMEGLAILPPGVGSLRRGRTVDVILVRKHDR